MQKTDHSRTMARIFSTLNKGTLSLSTRESGTFEFKETFNWGSKDKYAKAMAAFANNRGGYIIFGIANSPRRLVGLSGQGFEKLDEATVTAYLNGMFSPELMYEKFSVDVEDKKIGVMYVPPHDEKPIIAIKNDGDIKEAEIYYRYNARNDKVKYPELKALFENARAQERFGWMKLFQRVSKIGIENAAVMDVLGGTLEGSKGALLIDAELIPKLKFIKEGNFSEKGEPTLKLVGDVRPVSVAGYRNGKTALRITTDPAAPAVREETILKQFPLSYSVLIKKLSKRYVDFKQNEAFHRIRRPLQKNLKYCRTRLLDPTNPRSSKKDFYSEEILDEFDKHYTKKK